MVIFGTRTEAARRGRSATATRQMTGAMVRVIELCPSGNELGWVTTVFDVVNDGRIGTKHRQVLLWTLGLDGNELAPRDVHQATKQFAFISNSTTLQFLDSTMREVRRLGGLPDAIDYLWMKRFMANLRANHHRASLPQSATNAHPVSRVAGVVQDRANVGEIIRPRQQYVLARCTTDYQQWFFKCFYDMLPMIGPAHVEHIVYRYGLDAGGLAQSVRSIGALVEHFGKFRTASDADQSMRANWATLHASGLPEEINEKTLLSRLNELRRGQTPAPGIVPGSASTAAPLAEAPADPPVPRPDPVVAAVPTAERDKPPDDAVHRSTEEGTMPRRKRKLSKSVELTPKEREIFEACREAQQRVRPPQNLKQWVAEKFGDSVLFHWASLRRKGAIVKEGPGRYAVVNVSATDASSRSAPSPKAAKTAKPFATEDPLHAAVKFFSAHRDLLAKQAVIPTAAQHLQYLKSKGWRLALDGDEVHLVSAS